MWLFHVTILKICGETPLLLSEKFMNELFFLMRYAKTLSIFLFFLKKQYFLFGKKKETLVIAKGVEFVWESLW